MSGNALDKIDEFFDFAALEHDSELRAIEASHQGTSLPFQPADNVTTMDWAANSTAMTRSVDATHSWDDSTYSASEVSIGQTAQQLPLFQVPQWSAPVNVNPTSASALTGASFSGEGPNSALAPPSSIDTSHPEFLCTENDNVPDVCHSESSHSWEPEPAGQAITSPEIAELPLGTSAPTQQIANASWKPASAKRKGIQSRIPIEAKQILEEEFAANAYPCSWEMDIIAHQANLDVKKVRNWFNNTRARKKCEGAYISEWFQSVCLLD